MVITNAMGCHRLVIKSNFSNKSLSPFLFAPCTYDFHGELVMMIKLMPNIIQAKTEKIRGTQSVLSQ